MQLILQGRCQLTTAQIIILYTIHKLGYFVKSFFITGLWYIATMRLLFIADGRSPITLSWLNHWAGSSDQIHLISSYPCDPPPGLSSFHILPLAFGGMAGRQGAGSRRKGLTASIRRRLRPLRYLLGPASLSAYQGRFRSLVTSIQPDLVHAMRIPFEGMLAAATPDGVPLAVSIWGNDLTLHANSSVWMNNLTRRVLERADGLLADTQRDIRLGLEWGFRTANPSLVVPGNGGVRSEIFYSIPTLFEKPIVFNPRGFRDYVRNDTFFQAIPLVLAKQPAVIFRCAAMAGQPDALAWVNRLKITGSMELLEPCPHARMGELFRGASVVVSPSTHDGTPNTLLEAMACGCFPVVGDLESLREWITPGENGLLIDPTDPRALADAILSVLEKPVLREMAKHKNAQIIAARADYRACMAMVDAFYRKIAERSGKVPDKPG